METRAVLANYETGTGELTAWSSAQVPHLLKDGVQTACTSPRPGTGVIAPDVGGGIGSKAVIYPEEIVVALLAPQLGRPIRWLEDRLEHFQAATHAPQQDLLVEAAASRDGTLPGGYDSTWWATSAPTCRVRTDCAITGAVRAPRSPASGQIPRVSTFGRIRLAQRRGPGWP